MKLTSSVLAAVWISASTVVHGTDGPRDCGCVPRRRARNLLYALMDDYDASSGNINIVRGDDRMLSNSKSSKAPSSSKKSSSSDIICDECFCEISEQIECNADICCDLEKRMLNDNEEDCLIPKDDTYRPWVVPKGDKNATLLAVNPGIWEIKDFLTKEEVAALNSAIERVESDTDLFAYCGPAHGHLSHCAHLSASNTLTEDDSKIFAQVLDKITALWPDVNGVPQRDWFFVQRMHGNNPPTDMHLDFKTDGTIATMSIVLYLNDADAGTVFDVENLVIKPEAGKVATWLNVFEDGSPNMMSSHGIQGLPSGGKERLAMAYSVFYDCKANTSMAQA